MKLMSCEVICIEMIISILLRAVLDPGHPVNNSAYQTGKLNSLLHNSVLMIDLQPSARKKRNGRPGGQNPYREKEQTPPGVVSQLILEATLLFANPAVIANADM
jgi:hypothetical protein